MGNFSSLFLFVVVCIVLANSWKETQPPIELWPGADNLGPLVILPPSADCYFYKYVWKDEKPVDKKAYHTYDRRILKADLMEISAYPIHCDSVTTIKFPLTLKIEQ